jgi:hypothetical protein
MAAFLEEFDRAANSAGTTGFLEGDWQVPRVPRPDSVPSVVTNHLQSPTARRRDVISEARARIAAMDRASPNRLRETLGMDANERVISGVPGPVSPQPVPRHLQRGAAVLQAVSGHVASPIALPNSNHWMYTDEEKRLQASHSEAMESLDNGDVLSVPQRTIHVLLKPRRSSRSRSPPKSPPIVSKPSITIPKVPFCKLQRAKTHHTLPKSPAKPTPSERPAAFPLASPVKRNPDRTLSPLKSPSREGALVFRALLQEHCADLIFEAVCPQALHCLRYSNGGHPCITTH